ncbi:hypothetical protein AAGC94_17435 [Clostridium sporogenes]|uniref:Uncharacterized protein n=2 Tax=Clostridium TaxID=1485 RepID=A0A7X5PCW7_CLOSG|nr:MULTISPECIES: hypothetical protein [Clostridium]AKC64040.1 hypothetical protein CLSPO_c33270 [Clostridium sporogenes]AKJ91178.1 membrane protein [Clostridium sporogenes]AVP62038.1 hypothetical protein C7M79_15610 [Clostridium botulinum]AVP65782.1 hypothetical protein C3B64_16650 [Clostridium botulinum]AVQ40347.1 hypothetical protein C7M56_17310 [Clostridium botulinum]
MSKRCRCKSKSRCRGRKGSGNGLIILILILLQFGCCRGFHNECHGGRRGCCEVDNSILFIIALYYLSCCGDFSLCC